MPDTYRKHSAAKKDYYFDWRALTNGRSDEATSDWLEEGETIASKTVVAEEGIIFEDDELIDDASAIRLWVSGGTAGRNYRITATVTTSIGRVDVQRMTFRVWG